jgi:hypothetical protein
LKSSIECCIYWYSSICQNNKNPYYTRLLVFPLISCYYINMNDELEIIFKQSAFRHGVTEADIRWAFNTVEFDELIQGFENKYRLLGFNIKGNLIEVLYNPIG